MPKQMPKRYEFKVFVTEGTLSEIDEIVEKEQYNGRGDYALTLIKRDLAERRHEKTIDKEFAILEDRKKQEKK